MEDLLKELEDDKKALSEIDMGDLQEDEDDEVIETEPEEEPEAEPEEVKPEEKKPEPAKEEVKTEPPLDDSGYARLRREAAANKKRAEEAERKNQELEARYKTPPAEEVDRPSAPELPAEVSEIIEENRYAKAGREFARMEQSFKEKTPDFEDVSNQYKLAVMQSIKVENPRMSDQDIIEKTTKQLLMKASRYMNDGYDPIEEMYHDAKALGFKQRPVEEPVPEPEKKPDLKKVAANRERNAGTASAPGQRAPTNVSREAAANYSPEEWKALPRDVRQRLLKGA